MEDHTIIAFIDRACSLHEKEESTLDLGRRGMLNSLHPCVPIEYEGETISIDALILPFMKRVWDSDIKTVACCQGDTDIHGYISFKFHTEIIKFCERFEWFKQYGEFYILNIHLGVQGMEQPMWLNYKGLLSYKPLYDDLYSVKIEPTLLSFITRQYVCT